MTVSSKAEFFALSRKGMLGNALRQWNIEEYIRLPESERPRLTSVRNCIAGGDTRVQRYRLSRQATLRHCDKLVVNHIVERDQLLLDESAPDDKVVLQAEVCNSDRFIEMRFALHSGVGMRQAYEQMQHVNGLRAVMILRHFLDVPSQETLFDILQDYPDCVTELSTYSVPVGVLGWNTLTWETRQY